MSAKFTTAICILAFFIQSTISCGYQAASTYATTADYATPTYGVCGYGTTGTVGYAAPNYATNYGLNYGSYDNSALGITTSGGGLPVTSVSSIAPAGLAIDSSNKIEGCLSSSGTLPFVSTVAVEGTLPSSGQAATTYTCGGNVGITPANGYSGYGTYGTYAGYGGYGTSLGNYYSGLGSYGTDSSCASYYICQ